MEGPQGSAGRVGRSSSLRSPAGWLLLSGFPLETWFNSTKVGSPHPAWHLIPTDLGLNSAASSAICPWTSHFINHPLSL